MRHHRPAVGLLYNRAMPQLIGRAGELVEYFAVMPDRLWFDFGTRTASGRRFHRALGTMEEIRRLAGGRLVAAHGLGLSLPAPVPLDEALVEAVAAMSHDLGGFAWFSEHLGALGEDDAAPMQAGQRLPVVYDDESFDLLGAKLRRLRQVLGCRILLENTAFFTPMPDTPMTEPAFFNRLYASGHCGALLDLHNLYVSELNGGMRMQDYLAQLEPNAVEEIHLAGGEDFAGVSPDGQAVLTPGPVWRIACEHAPRFRRLRAITFEFQESDHRRIATEALVAELERMHELAARCVTEVEDADAD